MNIQHETAERLHGYYGFPESVIERVSELTEIQARFDNYPDFLRYVGVEFDGSVPEKIDIRPKEYDPREIIVVHTSMGNPLNPHNIYGVAGLAALCPNKRFLAYGNPSQPGMNHGTLNRNDRKAVVSGDFQPAVQNLIRFLESEKIERVAHVGGSYGAELAITAADTDVAGVSHLVVTEPVTNKAKELILPKVGIPIPGMGVVKLGLEFQSSDERMAEYVEKNKIDSYKVAFDEKGGILAYGIGLLRATNIAVSRGLAKGGFRKRSIAALSNDNNVNAILSMTRGTESELCDGVAFEEDYKVLSELFPGRVHANAIPGQAHAMGNDLALWNAINLTGLEK